MKTHVHKDLATVDLATVDLATVAFRYRRGNFETFTPKN